jgi:hypothetical protein
VYWRLFVIMPNLCLPRIVKQRYCPTYVHWLWYVTENIKHTQLHEYNTFIDKGKAILCGKHVSKALQGCRKIRIHTVYNAKHDGRHKACMVAGGHLTPVPPKSIYSGVVSLQSLCIVVFLTKLNSLNLWGANIGSAYLEA